jgi:cytochrome c553
MRGISLGTVAIIVAVTLATLALVGFLIAASGVYNVAASKPHFAVTFHFLHFALRRSVATHSNWSPSPPPSLGDPDLVRLGAGHFVRGCAFCHGAPGEPRNVAAQRMQPSPPALSLAAPAWSDAELFWIVKHGFKYTGMPAWPAQQRDDEVWAVVAFLRQLPNMSPATYREMTTAAEGPATLDRAPETSGLIAECARCHGDEESPPTSRLVPKLAGQTSAYFLHALNDYANRRRASGIMELITVPLDGADWLPLANYYAQLPKRPSEPASASADLIERGREIATRGIANEGIPACLACHSGRAAASFPLLSGQHAPYLAQQLRLLREGVRARTPQGAIMTAVAQRLDDAQIEAVAAYFESRDPAADVRGGPQASRGAIP